MSLEFVEGAPKRMRFPEWLARSRRRVAAHDGFETIVKLASCVLRILSNSDHRNAFLGEIPIRFITAAKRSFASGHANDLLHWIASAVPLDSELVLRSL